MTINKVIETLFRLKPNAVQDQDVADWLINLDGRLFTELKMPEDTVRPHTWPEDGDVELTAPAPYDELYLYYAIAMVEFIQRNYGDYNNSMDMYNNAYYDWRRQYRRTHAPEPVYFDV